MLFFTASSLIAILFDSASSHSLASSVGVGIGFSICLPLLKFITAFTSSIPEVGSLEELTSWTPLGLACVWEGNFPFSCTYCWLVSLAIEYCRLSNFWAISYCRFSIFLFKVLSTVLIF